MVLSADSAMLTGKKPYFLPEDMGEIVGHPCSVVRISRLGKHIAPKFADRYCDAVANGIHFLPEKAMLQAICEGHSWTDFVAYDMSLAVGEWIPVAQTEQKDLILPIEDAIAQASRCMTIRQGDWLMIYRQQEGFIAHKEMIIEEDGLYCKIK